MASKKYIELQNFSTEELQNELNDTVTQYGKMQLDHNVMGLENPLSLREVRRDIARMKSELRRRELADADEATLANRSKIRERRKSRRS